VEGDIDPVVENDEAPRNTKPWEPPDMMLPVNPAPRKMTTLIATTVLPRLMMPS